MKLVSRPGGATASTAAVPPAAAPEPDVFDTLYRRHRARLYLFCLARTHDPRVAEDVVQNVFERAFRHRQRFDPSRSFWSWIASIAARECVDVHRRRTYAQSRLADLTRSTETTPLDSTAEAVLGRLDYEALRREMFRLPVRQRAALELFAFDGWSYADIARHLGDSADSVKALIVRARRKLRETGVRALAGVGGLAGAMRRRLHHRSADAHMALSACGPWLGGWVQAAASNAAAVLLAAVALAGAVAPAAADPSPRAGPQRSSGRTASIAADVASPGGPATAPSARPAPAPTPPSPTEEPAARHYTAAVERTVDETLAPLLPSPTAAEESYSDSSNFAVSPDYEHDHTVFLAPPPSSSVVESMLSPLVVTRDGGASWQARRALGLRTGVTRLLLPPQYPRDNRVFAVSLAGLQVSRDDGDTFQTVLALPGIQRVALSPAFDRGDPSALVVAAAGVLEYRDDRMMAAPVRFTGDFEGLPIHDVDYAAGYPADPTVLVASRVYTMAGTYALHLGHCTQVGGVGRVSATFACTRTSVQEAGASYPSIDALPSTGPASGPVFVQSGTEVHVSHDGGRTFARARRPFMETGIMYWAWDMATRRSHRGTTVVLGQSEVDLTSGTSGPPLLRSDDDGRTWTPIRIGLPGFLSASRVAITPTGRLLVVSRDPSRLACSADGGQTWARLCPTPDGTTATSR